MYLNNELEDMNNMKKAYTTNGVIMISVYTLIIPKLMDFVYERKAMDAIRANTEKIMSVFVDIDAWILSNNLYSATA